MALHERGESPALAQLTLEPPLLGDVGHDDAHRRRSTPVRPVLADQAAVEGGAIGPVRPPRRGCAATRSRRSPGARAARRRRGRGRRLRRSVPTRALRSTLSIPAAVRLAPTIGSARVECQVPDRREVVEVHLPFQRLGEGDLGPAKLLGLHLQLDLMDLEFVQQVGFRRRSTHVAGGGTASREGSMGRRGVQPPDEIRIELERAHVLDLGVARLDVGIGLGLDGPLTGGVRAARLHRLRCGRAPRHDGGQAGRPTPGRCRFEWTA